MAEARAQPRQVHHRAGRPRGPGRRHGAGKSTLIKLLTAMNAYGRAGKARTTSSASTSRKTSTRCSTAIARMLDDISAPRSRCRCRRCVRCWLLPLSGDDVFKPLGVLSGGERNRYALARILVSPSNFLLLDEPTNTSTCAPRTCCFEALAAFSGTVVFVSHTATLSTVWRLACLKWRAQRQQATRQLRGLFTLERGAGCWLSTACHPERSEGPAVRAVFLSASNSGPAATTIPSPEESPFLDRPRRLNPINRSRWKSAARFWKKRLRASRPPSRIPRSSWVFTSPPRRPPGSAP